FPGRTVKVFVRRQKRVKIIEADAAVLHVAVAARPLPLGIRRPGLFGERLILGAHERSPSLTRSLKSLPRGGTSSETVRPAWSQRCAQRSALARPAPWSSLSTRTARRLTLATTENLPSAPLEPVAHAGCIG